MSSMNLIHSNGISPLGAFNSNCSSRAAMNKFAYDGATGVPIAVPCVCRSLEVETNYGKLNLWPTAEWWFLICRFDSCELSWQWWPFLICRFEWSIMITVKMYIFIQYILSMNDITHYRYYTLVNTFLYTTLELKW